MNSSDNQNKLPIFNEKPRLLKYVPVEKIEPGSSQPRDYMGELDELVESIKQKGIIEPLIIRPKGDKYEIVSGERRYRAAIIAGLREIPCIEMEVDDREAMEIALVENLHRKDLTVFEEAEAYRALVEIYGYTHAQIAERVARARSTVTELLTIANMPPRIKQLCKDLGIETRSVLLQIAKLPDEKSMEELARRVASEKLTREEVRQITRKRKRKRLSRFTYTAPSKEFSIDIKFKKEEVSPEEIIKALEELIQRLREEIEAKKD